jgi:hypothetical protein
MGVVIGIESGSFLGAMTRSTKDIFVVGFIFLSLSRMDKR